jgi:hypothetical protein
MQACKPGSVSLKKILIIYLALMLPSGSISLPIPLLLSKVERAILLPVTTGKAEPIWPFNP